MEVLRGNKTPLFCLLVESRDDAPSTIKPEDTRWSELPSSPVVSRYRGLFDPRTKGDAQCYTLPATEADRPPADPLASALGRIAAPVDPRDEGFSAHALAIRREDAARLFDLAEPASTAPDHVEDAREMVTAPSASPPAPADPVAPPAGAAARPEAPAAAQSPAAPRGVVRNSASRKRADPLGAVFRRAKQEATDPTCPHSVWAALMALAAGKNPPPELTDFDDEKGIQATGARNGWLSKDAFIERWRRGTV